MTLAGRGVILVDSLEELNNHVVKFEIEYCYHFSEFPNFGAYFLNKVHVGVQRFLYSCASGISSRLNVRALDFSGFLSSIENRSIEFIRLPKYIKDSTPKPSKKRNRDREDHDQGGETKKKVKAGKEKVQNEDSDTSTRLAQNMVLGEVLCKEVREGITQPGMDDGIEMRNIFYGKGYSFANCKRSHKKRNTNEASRWKKFLQTILARYKAKKAGREMPGE